MTMSSLNFSEALSDIKLQAGQKNKSSKASDSGDNFETIFANRTKSEDQTPAAQKSNTRSAQKVNAKTLVKNQNNVRSLKNDGTETDAEAAIKNETVHNTAVTNGSALKDAIEGLENDEGLAALELGLVEEEAEFLLDDILAELAQLFNISPEMIMQTLQELDMNIFDLADSGNLSVFLTKINNLSDTVELLHIPQITQTFEAVKKLLGENPQALIHATANTQQPREFIVASNKPAAGTETETEASLTGSDGEELLQPTQNRAASQTLRGDEQSRQNSNDSQNTEQHADSGERRILVERSGASTPQRVERVDITPFQAILNQAEAIVAANTAVIANANVQKMVDPQEVLNQIVERVKIDVTPNSSEVKMSLRPETLGDLSLKIRTENGLITAQFVAESLRVKEIIEANFNALRNSLFQQGIAVSELSVSVGQENQSGQSNQANTGSNGAIRGSTQNRVGLQLEDTVSDTDVYGDVSLDMDSGAEVNYVV